MELVAVFPEPPPPDLARTLDLAGLPRYADDPSAPDTGSTDAHRYLEALKAFLVGHNVELEYKALQPGLLGYTDGPENDKGLPRVHYCFCLCYLHIS